MKDRENLFTDIFEVVKLIPKGRVTSYGAIAEYLGMKSAARMVGWAMHASHTDPSVPAHRVLNSKGILSGKHHFGSPKEMQRRLEKEGIKVKNDQVVNFENHLWLPKLELL